MIVGMVDENRTMPCLQIPRQDVEGDRRCPAKRESPCDVRDLKPV